MTNSLLKYFGWSLIQHSIILACTWFLPIEIGLKVVLATAFFSLVHIPNSKLMAITLVGGAIIYFIFGALFVQIDWLALLSMPIFCFGHALIGRYLIEQGMEMRVLWLYPRR